MVEVSVDIIELAAVMFARNPFMLDSCAVELDCKVDIAPLAAVMFARNPLMFAVTPDKSVGIGAELSTEESENTM